jgi:hypothetical protein
MLTNSGHTLSGDSGTAVTLSLGDNLAFDGDATKGVAFAVAKATNLVTYSVTVADASSSQKGVATFNTASFDVTSGDVTIKTAGVTNTQLANSTISFTGTSGSDPVSLGETLTFSSTVTGLVATAVTANAIALDVRNATTTETGVASFNTDHFSVSTGAVSLAASIDDLNNVSSADAAATGDLLTKTAGDWQPVSRATLAGTINLGDLGNVGTATPTDGHVLTGSGTEWEGQKIYHLETVSVAATTWSVTHNIGQKYCNVTVVDASDEVVIPQSITFNSTTALTVVFNTAIAGKVVVMGIA